MPRRQLRRHYSRFFVPAIIPLLHLPGYCVAVAILVEVCLPFCFCFDLLHFQLVDLAICLLVATGQGRVLFRIELQKATLLGHKILLLGCCLRCRLCGLSGLLVLHDLLVLLAFYLIFTCQQHSFAWTSYITIDCTGCLPPCFPLGSVAMMIASGRGAALESSCTRPALVISCTYESISFTTTDERQATLKAQHASCPSY